MSEYYPIRSPACSKSNVFVLVYSIVRIECFKIFLRVCDRLLGGEREVLGKRNSRNLSWFVRV
jgi:hypothetical protein